MGVIRTKLVIDGEAEYRKAISACNSELKALGSGLALTKQEFEGTANSVEALTAKQENMSKQVEVQREKLGAMQKALENSARAMNDTAEDGERLKTQLAETKKALENVDQSAGDAAKQQETLKTHIRELTGELEKNQDTMQRLRVHTAKWQDSTNKAQKELNDMQAELATNARYLEEAAASADGAASAIDGFGRSVGEAVNNTKAAASAVPGIGKATIEVTKNIGTLSEVMKRFREKGILDLAALSGGFSSLASGVTQALGGYIKWVKETSAAVRELRKEQNELTLGFELTLNKTRTQAQSMTQEVNKIYTAGISDSKEAIAEALAIVEKFLRISGDAGRDAAKKMLLIKNYFGEDFSTQMNSVNTMMQHFGLDASAALDAIVYGMQNIKDGRGELLDVLAEYASSFQRLGYDANQFLAMMKAAGDAGAYSLDKAADVVKEFYNKAVDPSEDFRQALEALGFSADEMLQKITSGGPAASVAMGEISSAIAAVGDRQQRAQLSAKIFGSQWEDVGDAVVQAMAKAVGGVEQFTGAGDEMLSTYETSIAGVEKALEHMGETVENEGKRIALWFGTLGASSAHSQLKDALGSAYLLFTDIEAFQRYNDIKFAKTREDTENFFNNIKELFSGSDEKGFSEVIANGISRLTGELEENAARAREAAEATEKYTVVSGQANDFFTSVKASLNELGAAYNEAYSAAQNSIENQMGLLTRFDAEQQTSIQTLQAAARSRIDALKEYNETFSALQKLDIDGLDYLLDDLSSYSDENLSVLRGLLETYTNDRAAFDDYISLMQEQQDAAREYAETIANYATDYQAELGNISDSITEFINGLDMSDEAGANIAAMIDAMIDETIGNGGRLISAMADLGDRARAALTRALSGAGTVTTGGVVNNHTNNYTVTNHNTFNGVGAGAMGRNNGRSIDEMLGMMYQG